MRSVPYSPMTGSSPTTVLITGMHRSGTSLLARLANLVGVDMGPEEEMLPATEFNSKGHWEPQQVVDINDDLFSMLGGSWDSPPLVPGNWRDMTDGEPLQQRARAFAAGLTGEVRGWKDPRLSITWPFWVASLSDVRMVVAFRAPTEVAASLWRRDLMPMKKARSLWVLHTAMALTFPGPNHMIGYPATLRDPVATMVGVADFCGLPSPEEGAITVASDFVSEAMQHHVTDGDEPDDLAGLLHRALSDGNLERAISLAADHIAGVQQQQDNSFSLIAVLNLRVTELDNRLEETQHALETTRADLGRAQHLGLELTRLADDLRAERDALRLKLSEAWTDLAAADGDPGGTVSASRR